MKLFDSHCHLDDNCYQKDRRTVIDRARAAGVAAMMVVGISPASSERAVAIAQQYPGLFASVGLHPHDAARGSARVLDHLRQIAAAHPDQVRAWGETGLDFNRMHSPAQDQETWLEKQIDAATGLGLPLIFHERDSGGRFLDLLKTCLPCGYPGVVHCFSGTPVELSAYLDLGLHIGITGIITVQKRGAPLREMIGSIPDDRLLVETDAPYLTPAPERNRYKRNEPALLRSTLNKLAEIKQYPPEKLADILWANTCRLFALQPDETDLFKTC